MKLRQSVMACILALGSHSVYASTADANEVRGYFRSPALHQQTLIFTAEGDLWKQSLSSAQASRLTSLPALETGAAISADGNWIAFEANYDGTTEVYVMPMAGGEAKRVSFEHAQVKVQGWTPDGQVLYASNNGVGPSNWVLRSVDPISLTSRDIALADANEGVVSADGETIFFSRFGLQVTGDNSRVYRGGTKGQLWRYDLATNQEAQQLANDHQGSMRQPMLWQQRLYFISDQSGADNIWSMTTAGKDLKQHTQYQDWAISSARMDNGRIVYQLGADIHLLDLASNNAMQANIALLSDFAQTRPKWVNQPLDYATSVNLSSQGDKAVITARSKVAVVGHDGSRLVEIASPTDSRLRSAVLSTDGKWVYAISDASGEQEIWQFAADGRQQAKQLTKNGNSLRMNLHLSPDGRYLAHDDYVGNVWLFDLTKNSNKLLVKNGEGLGPYQDVVWSSNSQYIALTKAELGKQRPQIVLVSVTDNKQQSLTTDKYESFSPSFSPDGHWLYFLSNRHFKATPSSPWGDRNMGPVFDNRTQVFALALTNQAQFPFQAPNELLTQAEVKDATEVDWHNVNQRLWQVPLAPANYSQLSVTDKALYLLDTQAKKTALKVVEISPQGVKAELVADDISDYQLSDKNDKMLLRKQSKPSELLIIATANKLPADLSEAKVNTEQWQLLLDPKQEWQQMFEDAWLMHRDSFFDANMRGLDWQAVKAKYQPLVDRVTDRHELNDLFKQMMGELNSLHSQVRGGDLAKDINQAKAASLGARLVQTSAGVQVAHIYQYDSEIPEQASPLAHPGVNAENGDLIIELNRKPVTNIADVYNLLRNQQGKQVLLTLERNGEKLDTIVKPVSPSVDNKLSYLDWVQNNQDKVTKASEGNIGYIHLYAMGANDIANFARNFYTNYEKDGLIIDVRRNRGGNIDSWIIEKLLRKAWAFWQPTRGTAYTNMQQTFRGHLVVLTDQVTYSDGETFAAGVKALGLAPLIGKQTAGAGVWLSGRNSLTDKGMARVAEFPQYAMDGRWIVEGRGVSPDIEVDNLPHATYMGQDAQLQRAISYLQDELQQAPIPKLIKQPMTAPIADDVK
ncbi:S41 family peptidase [Shewanella marina]|uniref:S41 family peptidase n=1 Tax=Shewanella marina TaxID=487319 RepID=UPI00046F9265|nr:S41 family peptidase [Shewanella marina]